MGKKSRTKGKSGELEFVHLAKEQGFDRAERRAPMQCADGDERHADLANVGRLWAEVKRHRRVNVQREMGVLLETERPGFVRVLFHRDDHGPALATLEASELLKLERDSLAAAGTRSFADAPIDTCGHPRWHISGRVFVCTKVHLHDGDHENAEHSLSWPNLIAKARPVPQEPRSCHGDGGSGGCCSSNAPAGSQCAGKCGGKP